MLRFTPFSLEPREPSPCARILIHDLAKFNCAADPDGNTALAKKLQTRYFWQRMSVALQTGNAQTIKTCTDRSLNSQTRVPDLFGPPVNIRDLSQ